MRAIVDYPDAPDRLLALCAIDTLQGIVRFNRWFLRTHPVPPLYRSGVRHRDEPWAGKVEEFAPIPTLLESGWGDCAQLCAWRIAELREAGIPATFRVIMVARTRESGDRDRLYHVQVRLPPTRGNRRGPVEDPTRRLEY